MPEVSIDLKDYIEDDAKRLEFVTAILQLLEQSNGNLIPVTHKGEVVAYLRRSPPKHLILL